jgi:hypothetical protein
MLDQILLLDETVIVDRIWRPAFEPVNSVMALTTHHKLKNAQ